MTAEDVYSKICTDIAINVESIVHAFDKPTSRIERINSVLFEPNQILRVIKTFKTRTFTSSKRVNFTNIEFPKVLLLQNKIESMISKKKNLFRIVKDSAKKELRNSIRISLQPILVAIQQTRRAFYSLKDIILNYGSLPEGGQYNISHSSKYSSSFIPGIFTNILKASKSQISIETVHCSFLVLQIPPNTSRNDLPPSVLESLTSLKPIIASNSRSIPLVRLIEGVEFTALSDSALLVYEWNSRWKTLKSLCLQHGGLLSSGYFEVFSLLAARILDAVIGLHREGIMVRSLSPSTIVIDEQGTNVRLLLLPTTSYKDDCNSQFLDIFCKTVAADFESSCLPNCGLHKNWNDESWDSWSFGMCLYFMAFGTVFSSKYDVDEPKADDNTFLNDIVNGFYLDTSRMYSLNQEFNDDKIFLNLLSSVSTDLVFRIFEIKYGHKLPELQSFRKRFCDLAPSYGIVLSSAYILWERVVSSIFSVFSPGSTSFKSVEERLFTRCKSKSSEGLREFCELSLGLGLTAQEFNLFIASLNSNSGNETVFVDGVKSLKNLSVLLKDIREYGYFQQTIYAVSRCLTCNESQRPTLVELRSLPIFSVCEEMSLMKATEDSKLLIAPFKNASEFCEREVIIPIQSCVHKILHASDGYSREHLDINVRAFSKVLTIIEELLLVNIDLSSGEKVDSVSQNLQDIGVNYAWLEAHIPDIFRCLSNEGAFRAIALFTLRISTIDETKYSKHTPSPSRTGSSQRYVSVLTYSFSFAFYSGT